MNRLRVAMRSTWPPELAFGRLFALGGHYMPPLPPGVTPPTAWGDLNFVRERLGTAVKELVFDRATMLLPALSPQHSRRMAERTAGPLVKLVELLTSTDAARLDIFRREYDAIVADYFEDNTVRQDYLLTRATKI